jgi:hypothetical protein
METIKKEILIKRLDYDVDSILILKKFLTKLTLELIKYIDDQVRTQLIEHCIDSTSKSIDELMVEVRELEEKLKNG